MMQLVRQILLVTGMVLAVCALLWLSFTLFVVFLIAGAVSAVLLAARRFLLAKGILNPRPGSPVEQPAEPVTIIEGEFEQIENPMVRDTADTDRS